MYIETEYTETEFLKTKFHKGRMRFLCLFLTLAVLLAGCQSGPSGEASTDTYTSRESENTVHLDPEVEDEAKGCIRYL